MGENNKIKDLVKQKYSEIALQTNAGESCCGSSCCTVEVYNIMNDDYSKLNGYEADADLGLGCGLPTQYAGIKQGNTVIDLGSGAGNDCFIARAEVGESGKVIGIDFTEAMVEKAQKNAQKRGYNNVSFRKGDIENMPVVGNLADVIISNCVLNLLPAKDKIFHEIFRVLKPEGHFCISDIVLNGELPEGLLQAAEMYAGCVAGAIQKNEYLVQIYSAGFENVKIEKEKDIIIPDEILEKYLDTENLALFKKNNSNIISSITVTGTKPAVCNCGSGCC